MGELDSDVNYIAVRLFLKTIEQGFPDLGVS